MPKRVHEEPGVVPVEGGYRFRIVHNKGQFERKYKTKVDGRKWRNQTLVDLDKCPHGVSYKNKKGWLAEVSLDGIEVSQYFPTVDEAAEWREQTVTSIKAKTFTTNQNLDLTFGDLLTEWNESKASTGDRTMMRYESLLKMHILPVFKNQLLSSIDKNFVRAWVAQMQKDGKTPQTIAKAHALLRQILKHAVEEEKIVRNSADGTSLPKIPAKQSSYLEYEQVEQLAEECGEYKVLVLTLATMGFRIGELRAIQVGDVDLERQELTIDKAFTINRSYQRVLSTTKTNQIRTVPIPGLLKDTLADFIDGRDPNEYLFRGKRGDAINEGWFRKRYFAPAVAKLGFKDTTLHTMRHSFISLLLNAGEPASVVSRLAGHSSSVLTMKTYSHVNKNDLKKSMTTMDSIMKSSPDKGLLRDKQSEVTIAN